MYNSYGKSWGVSYADSWGSVDTPTQPTGSADSIGYDIIRSTRLQKIRKEDDEMIMTVIAAFMEMNQ